MNNYRNPNCVERYEDAVFDLETALNINVANNAHQKKNRTQICCGQQW